MSAYPKHQSHLEYINTIAFNIGHWTHTLYIFSRHDDSKASATMDLCTIALVSIFIYSNNYSDEISKVSQITLLITVTVCWTLFKSKYHIAANFWGA